MSLALDLLERLEYTRAGADAVTASMSLVQLEEQYCRAPDEPSKAREEEFLKAREASVAEYRNRYLSLRRQLQTLITRDGNARRVVDDKFAGNPLDNQSWTPWTNAFQRALRAIAAKRAELKSIPEVSCRTAEPQQAAPEPPPPADPGVNLPKPMVRPVAYPEYKAPFCSEAEKQAVIAAFRAVAWDYYMNYQDAREYHDAITEALARGQGNANVLRSLLPDAKKNLDTHAKALDDFHKELQRVIDAKVVECPQETQTAPEVIPPLIFDPFVYPAVPGEFCTQDARNETVRQLEAARNTARRNYDKAASRVTELGDRIAKGDNATTTSEAFNAASNSASEWMKQSNQLDADIQRASAIPVAECANPPKPALPEYGFGTGIKIGYTFAATNFRHFTEVVGDRPGIVDYSADNSPVMSGPFVEFNVNNYLRFGTSVLFGKHNFAQQYAGGRTTGVVNAIFADTRLSYARPTDRWAWLLGGGITWVRNESTDIEHAGQSIAGTSESGFMTNLGAALEFPLFTGYGGRVSADYTTSFTSPNADEHRRLTFTFFRIF